MTRPAVVSTMSSDELAQWVKATAREGSLPEAASAARAPRRGERTTSFATQTTAPAAGTSTVPAPAHGETYASQQSKSTDIPCIHAWLIATPNGPTCEGVCRKCNEHRTYSSSGDDEPDNPWSRASAVRREKAGQQKAKKGGARSVNQAQAFYGALR